MYFSVDLFKVGMDEGDVPVHGIFQQSADESHDQRRGQDDMLGVDIPAGDFPCIVLDAANGYKLVR